MRCQVPPGPRGCPVMLTAPSCAAQHSPLRAYACGRRSGRGSDDDDDGGDADDDGGRRRPPTTTDHDGEERGRTKGQEGKDKRREAD